MMNSGRIQRDPLQTYKRVFAVSNFIQPQPFPVECLQEPGLIEASPLYAQLLSIVENYIARSQENDSPLKQFSDIYQSKALNELAEGLKAAKMLESEVREQFLAKLQMWVHTSAPSLLAFKDDSERSQKSKPIPLVLREQLDQSISEGVSFLRPFSGISRVPQHQVPHRPFTAAGLRQLRPQSGKQATLVSTTVHNNHQQETYNDSVRETSFANIERQLNAYRQHHRTIHPEVEPPTDVIRRKQGLNLMLLQKQRLASAKVRPQHPKTAFSRSHKGSDFDGTRHLEQSVSTTQLGRHSNIDALSPQLIRQTEVQDLMGGCLQEEESPDEDQSKENKQDQDQIQLNQLVSPPEHKKAFRNPSNPREYSQEKQQSLDIMTKKMKQRRCHELAEQREQQEIQEMVRRFQQAKARHRKDQNRRTQSARMLRPERIMQAPQSPSKQDQPIIPKFGAEFVQSSSQHKLSGGLQFKTNPRIFKNVPHNNFKELLQAQSQKLFHLQKKQKDHVTSQLSLTRHANLKQTKASFDPLDPELLRKHNQEALNEIQAIKRSLKKNGHVSTKCLVSALMQDQNKYGDSCAVPYQYTMIKNPYMAPKKKKKTKRSRPKSSVKR